MDEKRLRLLKHERITILKRQLALRPVLCHMNEKEFERNRIRIRDISQIINSATIPDSIFD